MFGRRVRELRRKHKLTQRDLAEQLQARGLRADFTYISKIENDRLDTPPSEELIRGIAAVLETDAEDLLNLAGKFDYKALQEVIVDMPKAGVLLRRIQNREITEEQIQRILNEQE